MRSEFRDHPRKQVVRSQYDRPLLERVSEALGTQYVYLGLPGPDMYDVNEWKDLIAKVIAFERPARYGTQRRNYEKLQVSLQKSGLLFRCYYGDIERVVVWGRDDDNEEFVQEELITLYNLDFCDHISSTIPVPPSFDENGTDGKRMECMRFEVLRQLLRLQGEHYRKGADPRFIMLLTVREGVHGATIRAWRGGDNPQEVREWLNKALGGKRVPGGLILAPDVLKPFVFECFRAYCDGLHIDTHFLPMVRYQGYSETMPVPMAHFAILCRFSDPRGALPRVQQHAVDFLSIQTLRASDAVIEPEPLTLETGGPLLPPDTLEVAEQFFS